MKPIREKHLEGKPEMASVVEQYNIFEESFAERLADAGEDENYPYDRINLYGERINLR